MLESDEINVHDCHKNSLIIDRFLREDVWPTEADYPRNQVQILQTIKNDLLKLLDNCGEDIQDCIKTFEFSEFLRPAVKLEPIGLNPEDAIVAQMKNL